MTVQQLVELSLQEIDELGVGYTASTDTYNLGFTMVNELIDSLSAEGVLLSQISEDAVPLTATNLYAWGPASSLASPHPRKILSARSFPSTSIIDLPVDIISIDEFDRIKDKSATSSYVAKLCYDYLIPTGGLRVWPSANAGGTLLIHSLKALTPFTSLSQTFVIPPGVERCLKLSLAIELGPLLRREVSDGLRGLAQMAKQAVVNANLMALGPNAAIQPQGARQ
jgi:hypothetical protein